MIYLAFLAKVANIYYMLLTAFKKYWPDTVAKFTSGTQDRFTLESGIDIGPTFINFGFFSRPYGLIREYIEVI